MTTNLQQQVRSERMVMVEEPNIEGLNVSWMRQDIQWKVQDLREIKVKDQNLQIGIETQKRRLLRGFEMWGNLTEQSLDRFEKIKGSRAQVRSKAIFKNQTSAANDRFISVNKSTVTQVKWVQRIRELQRIIQIHQRNEVSFKQQILVLHTKIQHLTTIIKEKQTLILQYTKEFEIFRQKSHSSLSTEINTLREQHRLEIQKIIYEINEKHRLEIQNIIQEMNEQLRRAENKDSFDMRIKQLEILIKEKQSVIIRLQNQMKANLEKDRKQGDINLRQKIYQLQTQLNRLTQILQRKDREKQLQIQRSRQKDQEINRLTLLIKQTRKHYEVKQSQLEATRKTVRKYQIQIEGLSRKFDIERQYLQQNNTNLKIEIERLNQKIETMRKQTVQVNIEYQKGNNEKRIQQLSKINIQLQDEISKIKLENISLKSLERKIIDRQRQTQIMQSEYQLSIKSLTQQINIIKQEYFSYKEEVELRKNQDQSYELRIRLGESEDFIRRLQMQKANLEEFENRFKSLSLRYEVLEKQNEKLKIQNELSLNSRDKMSEKEKNEISRLYEKIQYLTKKYQDYDSLIDQKNLMSIKILELQAQAQRYQETTQRLRKIDYQLEQTKKRMQLQLNRKEQELNQEMQKSRVRIFALQKQVNKLGEVQIKLVEAQKHILDLQTQFNMTIKSLHVEITHLKIQIDRLRVFEIKCVELQKQIHNMSTKQNIQGESRINQLYNEITTLRIQLEELKRKIRQAQNYIRQLQDQLNLKNEIKHQETESVKKNLELQIIKLSSEVERLRIIENKYIQFEKTLNNTNKNQYAQQIKLRLENEIIKLKIQVQRLINLSKISLQWQSKYQQSQIYVEKLQAQILRLKAEILRLSVFEMKVTELTTQIITIRSQSNTQYQLRLTQAEGRRKLLQEQIQRLRLQIQKRGKIEDQDQGLRNNLLQAKNHINSLESQINILNAQINKFRDIQQKLIEAQAYIFSFESRSQPIQSQTQQIQKLKKNYEVQILKLKSEISRLAVLEIKVTELNRQILAIRSQSNTQFQSRIVQAERARKGLEEQIQRLKIQIQRRVKIEGESEQVKFRLGDAQKYIVSLQQQIQKLNIQIQRLRVLEGRLFEAESYISQLQNQAGNQIQKRLIEAEKRIAFLESQIEKMKLQIDRLLPFQFKFNELNKNVITSQSLATSEFQSQTLEQKKTYEAQILRLKAEISRLQVFEIKVTELTTQIITIRSQSNTQYQLRLTQAEGRRKLLEEQIQRLRLQIQKRGKIKDQSQELKDILRQTGIHRISLESQISKLNNQINRLKVFEVQLISLQKQLFTMQQRYTLLEKNYQDLSLQLNSELSFVRSQLQNIRKAIQQFLKSFNFQNITFTSIHNQNLPDYIRQLYALINRIHSIFSERQKIVTTLQTECIQLKKIISSSNQRNIPSARIEQLEHRIFQLSTSNENYLRVNNSLSAKLEASQLERQFLFNEYSILRCQLEKLQNISVSMLSDENCPDSVDVDLLRKRLNTIESVAGESLVTMKTHYSQMQKQIQGQLQDLRKIVDIIENQQSEGASTSRRITSKTLSKLQLDVAQLQTTYRTFQKNVSGVLKSTTNEIKDLSVNISQKIVQEFKNIKDKHQHLNQSHQELQIIKRKYYAAESTIQTMEKEKEIISSGITKLKGEMQTMKKQIQSVNTQYLIVKNQSEGWKEQNFNLKAKIQKYQVQVYQHKNQALSTQYQEAFQNQAKHAKFIQDKLMQAQSYISELQRQKQFLIQQIQKLEFLNNQILTQKNVLDLKNAQLSEGSNKVNQIITEFEGKLQRYETIIKQTELERDNLLQQLNSTIQQNNKWVNKNQHTKTIVAQLEKMSENWQRSLKDKEQIVSQLSNEKLHLVDQINKVLELNMKLLEQRNALDSRITQLSSQSSESHGQLIQMQGQLQRKLQTYETIINQAKLQINELQQTLTLAIQQNKRLLIENTRMKTVVEQFDQTSEHYRLILIENEEILSKLPQKDQHISILQNEIRDLKKRDHESQTILLELQTLKSKLSTTQNYMFSIQQQKGHLTKQIERVNNINEQIVKQKNLLDQKVKQLSNKAQNSIKTIETVTLLERRLQNYEVLVQQAESERNQLRNQLDTLQKTKVSNKQQNDNQALSVVVLMERKLQNYAVLIEQAEKERNELNNRLNVAIQENKILIKENLDAKSLVKQFQAALKLQNRSNEVQRIISKLNEAEQYILMVQTQKMQLIYKNQILQGQVQQLQTYKKHTEQQLKLNQGDIGVTNTQAEILITNLRKQLDVLSGRLNGAQQYIAFVEQQKQQAEITISSLNEEFINQNKFINKLNIQKQQLLLQAQKSQYSGLITTQRDEIDRMRKQIQRITNMNQNLVIKCSQYELKLSEGELLSQRYEQVFNELVESEKTKQIYSTLINNLQQQLNQHKAQLQQFSQRILGQVSLQKNNLQAQNQQLKLKLNKVISELENDKNNSAINAQIKELNQFLYNCLIKIQVLESNANIIEQQLRYTQKTLKNFLDKSENKTVERLRQIEGKQVGNEQEFIESQNQQQNALRYIKEIVDSDKNYIAEKTKLQQYLDLLQRNILKSQMTSGIKHNINYPFDPKDDIHRQLKDLSNHVAIYHCETNRRNQMCLSMVELLIQGTDDILRTYVQMVNDLPQMRIKEPQMESKMNQLLQILTTLSHQLYPDQSPFPKMSSHERDSSGERGQFVSSNYIQILKVVQRKNKDPSDEQFSNALNHLKATFNDEIQDEGYSDK